jgi:hypothetical protein
LPLENAQNHEDSNGYRTVSIQKSMAMFSLKHEGLIVQLLKFINKNRAKITPNMQEQCIRKGGRAIGSPQLGMYHDEQLWRSFNALRTPWRTSTSHSGGAWPIRQRRRPQTLGYGDNHVHAQKLRGGSARAVGGGCKGPAVGAGSSRARDVAGGGWDGGARGETAAGGD